jgi:SAM-dependent methyltransferase
MTPSAAADTSAGASGHAEAASRHRPVRDPASYRDPSGFVYRRDRVLYRQVNTSYAADWDALIGSGLYERLANSSTLVRHEPADLALAATPDAYRVIRPAPVDLISYPYEWTFGEIKDAALLTLDAQLTALELGMTLKDASAYNVQYQRGSPVLIDSLSFERFAPGVPWVAYRQFCEHFLAPLALMARRDIRCGRLLREHLDGIPLDFAARLLPGRTRLEFGLATHVHLHARAQRRYGDRFVATDGPSRRAPTMSLDRLRALVANLRATVAKLDWTPEGTEWADYAERTSYGDEATRAKDVLVDRFVRASGARTVIDFGANTGRFSRIAADAGCTVVACDIDPAAAERHYRTVRQEGRRTILPLVIDLADPSPAQGWAGRERAPFSERVHGDLGLALALVHHLAISRNVPLPLIAEYLATLVDQLLVEFVPKHDAMVRRLLASRRDVFPEYTIEGFRAALAAQFAVIEEVPIEGSARVLFYASGRRDEPLREATAGGM